MSFDYINAFLDCITDRLGRKPVILAASVVFTAGSIVMGAADGKEGLLAGRIIVGVGIGKEQKNKKK